MDVIQVDLVHRMYAEQYFDGSSPFDFVSDHRWAGLASLASRSKSTRSWVLQVCLECLAVVLAVLAWPWLAHRGLGWR